MKNYKEWLIFRPITDFYNMFFNNDKGFSWRKMAATAGFVFAKLGIDRLKDENHILDGSVILLVFSGVCIGLITIPELIKGVSLIFKGKSEDSPVV